MNTYEEACTGCGKPTHGRCDGCDKPFDAGCLFKSGKILELPADPRNEDYAERPTWRRAEFLCIACYQTAVGHAPNVLWAETSAETTLLLSAGIEKGSLFYAGDAHSWYQAPHAGNMLKLQWGDQHIELDTFRTLQLLDFLKAHEPMIREEAKAASDILVPYERKMTERAIRADLGIEDE